MRKIKSLNVKQSKSQIALINRSETSKLLLHEMAKALFSEKLKQQQNITAELEIDIVLICLNTCKYVLAGIIWLGLYAS